MLNKLKKVVGATMLTGMMVYSIGAGALKCTC